ncbi:MAG: hypothetical protein LBD30_09435 [Verrucomicrobiales bacterium]|nr:hypothetical protein [Verrucomicrobiales bacterium]
MPDPGAPTNKKVFLRTAVIYTGGKKMQKAKSGGLSSRPHSMREIMPNFGKKCPPCNVFKAHPPKN